MTPSTDCGSVSKLLRVLAPVPALVNRPQSVVLIKEAIT